LEGADLTLTHLGQVRFVFCSTLLWFTKIQQESKDAQELEQVLKKKTPKCKFQLISTDLRGEKACKELVQKHTSFHSSGKLDIL